MTGREFQINVERQLNTLITGYNTSIKFNSDLLFYYINRAKDSYVKQFFRVFQQNQEISDNIRTLVTTKTYSSDDITAMGARYEVEYPSDYVFAVGENVYIAIKSGYNVCTNITKSVETDVLEATVENLSSQLNNSLSDHRLRHNIAKPIRVYQDNKIVLYTDGKYSISNYKLTYLRKAKDLGAYADLTKEYTDLPENTHQEIVDLAVQLLLSSLPNNNSSKEKDDE